MNQFTISNGVANQSYSYYPDGRLQFVDNLTDGNFDRSYTYDHVGRLATAASGAAANQQAGNVPYWETFAYDAFGHTTARETEVWSQDSFSDAGSYSNNRRTGWGYDADGRIKTIDTRQYHYDAGGAPILLTGQVWWEGYGYYNKSISSGMDGDGNRVKEVTTDIFSTLTTHYLRSSVLGGAIMQEMNSAGQTTTYVYTPDGQLLTKQLGIAVWKHQSPAGTGEYHLAQSGFIQRKEFDPVGADVPLTQPEPLNRVPEDGELSGSHSGASMDARFANLGNPAAGCVAGWLELPCSTMSMHGSLTWLGVAFKALQK